MLRAAVEQFIDKEPQEIEDVAMSTLEGHQRGIMGSMTVDEIYKDRKKFSQKVYDQASQDLFNMGIQIISYTLKDIKDDNAAASSDCLQRQATPAVAATAVGFKEPPLL